MKLLRALTKEEVAILENMIKEDVKKLQEAENEEREECPERIRLLIWLVKELGPFN